MTPLWLVGIFSAWIVKQFAILGTVPTLHWIGLALTIIALVVAVAWLVRK
jgi:hypothetical protein